MIVDVTFEGRPYSFRTHGPQDHIARVMRSTGRFYEEDLLRAIRDLDRRGIYVDVGAHIGNHTVFFAAECRSTFVDAFEANDDTCDILDDNCDGRGESDIYVCRAAVGAESGHCALERRDPTNSGMDRTVPGNGVLVRTLDHWFDVDEGSIAVIKIDVEGNELAVLEGAERIIEAHHPVIAVEMNSRTGVSEFLAAHGYKHHGTYCATPTEIWV